MFPYIGGKSQHVKWMDPLFYQNSSTFVEVFGGAGWVSVKSNSIISATRRIYNDFNPLLSNVYECFRKDPIRVINLMEQTPVSDINLYKKYQKELFLDLDWRTVRKGDFDLAVKYLYLQTQVFAGTPLSSHNVPYFCDVKSNGKYQNKFITLKNKLQKSNIQQRLSEISIVESLDCIDLIKKYDSPETFFYVDPPYYKMEFYYSKDFPREKHQELAETLSGIQGKFALSYYDFDDLSKFYPEDKFSWHRQLVYRAAATRSSVTNSKEIYNSKSKGTEILIMNYDPNNSTNNVDKKDDHSSFRELFVEQL